MSSELSPKVLELLSKQNAETIKIEPVVPGLVTKPTQEDFNFFTTVQDMVSSVPAGIFNAIENTADFINENMFTLGGVAYGKKGEKLSFKNFNPRIIGPTEWKDKEYSNKRNLPIFHKPKTLAGNMTEGMSRFITGFLGPSKFLKGAGLVGTKLKGAGRAIIAGGVSDLTVFDPNEGRLSDMLVEFDSPVLNNSVTQFLASDEDDTEMEGRLKNVLEGFGLGGIGGAAFESIFYGIKGFKKMKGTRNLKERAKVQKEIGRILNDTQKGKKTLRVRKFALEGDKGINSKLALEGNESIKPKEALKIIAKSKETAKKDTELWIQKILNTKSFTAGGSVLRTIDNIVANGLDDVTKDFLQNDVFTNEAALQLAKLTGGDQKQILKSIFSGDATDKEGVVRLLVSKSTFQQLAIDFQKISTKYLDDFGENQTNWSKEAKLDIATRQQVIQEVFTKIKKQVRGAARTTQAGNIKVPAATGTSFDMDKIASIFKDFNANPAVIAKKIKDMKPDEVINQLTKSKLSKIIEVFNSLYINSILSGTPTFMVNLLGNGYELILKPLEMASGAILRGDKKTMYYGFSHYYGMSFTMRDTIRAVGLSLKQGNAILDPLVRTQDNLQIINGKAVRPISGSNLDIGGIPGRVTDATGILAELPVRLLAGTDELFKQMNYRGRLYAEAINNTLELGYKINSKEGLANIDKIFKNGFKKNGEANIVDNPMAARALENARVATFTNLLDDGRFLNIGLGVQNFLKQVPALRFLAPFVRTPTQLWRNFEQRIPILGAMTKPMRDMWKYGGDKGKADVLGRQLFGVATTITAYNYAMQDVTDSKGNKYRKVTGAGPKDYNLKKLWQNNGWQAYSLASKNKDGTVSYRQYNRNDPRFYVLGIMADIFENHDNINDEKKQNMAWVAIISAMRSAGNKAYLRGVSDAFDIVDDLDKLPQYIGKQLANTIPYTAFTSQGIPGILEPDTEMFQARSFIDEILKKAPFINKTKYLEPRINILTGNPVEKTPSSLYWNPQGVLSQLLQGPVLVGREVDVKEDEIGLEIMRLKMTSITEPNEMYLKTINLVDFKIKNQSAHNYWVERIGKTTKRGLTFREQLEITFDSLSYKRKQEGNENFDAGKEMAIKKIFQLYKEEAKQDMLKKYPEVAKAAKLVRNEKYGLRERIYDINEQPKELLPRR